MAAQLLRWLSIFICIYVVLGAVLYFFQRSFLYFPRSYTAVPGVTEVTLRPQDARLHGYIANPGQDQLLLYFGGNAEQVARGLADLASQLPEVTVIGFDYRGFGRSEGSPTEENLYRDALAIYDRYADSYSQVNLYGRSLGSGVATYLAVQRPVDRLVLVTPIDGVARIAARRFWFYPIDLLLKDRYDSLSRAPKIQSPVLLLVAENDHIVQAPQVEHLKEAFASEQVQVVRLEGVGHNNIQESSKFAPVIRRFLHTTESNSRARDGA